LSPRSLTRHHSQCLAKRQCVMKTWVRLRVSDSKQQQSHAQQQSVQPTTQPKPSTSLGPTKKRKKADDEEAIAAIGQYFTSKASKPSAVVPSATTDDDLAFVTVIGLELKKIKTPWIKCTVKKQLMDVVFNRQEQEEQQQVLQLVVSAKTAQPLTQPQSSTGVISASDSTCNSSNMLTNSSRYCR